MHRSLRGPGGLRALKVDAASGRVGAVRHLDAPLSQLLKFFLDDLFKPLFGDFHFIVL